MLDISPVLLLSSAIIFLLVMARLNSNLYEPLLKHMDERKASIQKDLEDAKSNSADVDSVLQEANDIIASAKKEAAQIREQAYQEAKVNADAKLSSAKAELEKKTFDFTQSLQNETQALKKSLLASIPQYEKSLQSKLKSI